MSKSTSELDGSWTVEKPHQRASLAFLDRIYVERGTLDDWRLLEALHYKHGAITPGSHYYRMVLDGETIGVLMMAAPKLLLKERHVVFPALKPGRDSKLSNTMRMKWINANMAIVSRVVVDTMYRSAGLAYRFTNLACRMDPKQWIEIQSAMSKYNQFAQKAGFKFCPPIKSNKFDVGMRFFRSTFDADPADTEGILNEIDALPPAQRESVIQACRDFYISNSMLENTGKALIKDEDGVMFRDRRIARLPNRELIVQIQQMTLAAPLYGVYRNPDADRASTIDRLPLSAFDTQAVTERLLLP